MTHVLISDDQGEEIVEQSLFGKKWGIKNMFPFEVVVKFIIGDRTYFMNLHPRKLETVNVPIGMGTEIKVYNSNKLISDPIIITSVSRLIIIGDIVYQDISNGMNQRNSSDILSIKLHNHTTIPLVVEYKGNIIGYLNQMTPDYDGKITISNNSNGFKLGDTISIYIAGSKTLYAKLLLHDNFISDVHLGMNLVKPIDLERPRKRNYIDSSRTSSYTF